MKYKTLYFEFNKHEYYALIAVTVEEKGTVVGEDPIKKAAEIYVETAAYESAEEVLKDGIPKQLTPEEAFWRLTQCEGARSKTVDELLKDLYVVDNGVIIIDKSLT